MEKKTITIRVDENRFLKDNDISLASFTRSHLEKAMSQDGTTDLPTGDSRRNDLSRHRTTVNLEQNQTEFVEAVNVNLSQFIQDKIQEMMRRRQKRIEAETNPGDDLREIDRNIIGIALASGISTEDGFGDVKVSNHLD